MGVRVRWGLYAVEGAGANSPRGEWAFSMGVLRHEHEETRRNVEAARRSRAWKPHEEAV